jgi:hypothetical protein
MERVGAAPPAPHHHGRSPRARAPRRWSGRRRRRRGARPGARRAGPRCQGGPRGGLARPRRRLRPIGARARRRRRPGAGFWSTSAATSRLSGHRRPEALVARGRRRQRDGLGSGGRGTRSVRGRLGRRRSGGHAGRVMAAEARRCGGGRGACQADGAEGDPGARAAQAQQRRITVRRVQRSHGASVPFPSPRDGKDRLGMS